MQTGPFNPPSSLPFARWDRVRSAACISVGVMLLLAQLAAIVMARATPRKYFCWAPNDYLVEYRLRVSRDGRDLPQSAVRARYRLPDATYEYPAEHIMDVIERYETTYGRNDHAAVELSYVLNGSGPERTWRWPHPGNDR